METYFHKANTDIDYYFEVMSLIYFLSIGSTDRTLAAFNRWQIRFTHYFLFLRVVFFKFITPISQILTRNYISSWIEIEHYPANRRELETALSSGFYITHLNLKLAT